MPWGGGGGGAIPPLLPTYGTSRTPRPMEGCLTVQRQIRFNAGLANLSIVVGFNLPQLHNNMTKLYMEVETCVIEAIDSISDNKKATISKLAKDLDVPAQ